MKKNLLCTVIVACALVLAGCATPGVSAPETTVAAETAIPTETTTAAIPAEPGIVPTGKVIAPLPSYLDLENLKDCTFAAGFCSKDVYLDGDGFLVIDLTVYDYELFDPVDIYTLQPGDVLKIGGQELLVETAEDVNGFFAINGGLENGGVSLSNDDSTVCFEILMNDAKNYQALGNVTIPVAQEFQCHDSEDLEAGEIFYYAGDFLMAMEKSETIFTPYGTTVRVENGRVMEVTRVYTP